MRGSFAVCLFPFFTNADGSDPYFQLDLGEAFANVSQVSAVRITARADSLLDESQHINVYVGEITNYNLANSVLCEADVIFGGLGSTITVLCPVNVPKTIMTRYVTVVMNTTANSRTKVISLQEVTPIWDGEAGGRPLAGLGLLVCGSEVSFCSSSRY